MPPLSDIRFARSGDVDLAYQVIGEGERNIVLMIGWVSHLEVLWELAEARRFVERLAGMGRVLLFDKRGTGLSDRPPGPPTHTDLVPDVLAVMDAAGMASATLVGWIDSAALAITVAATHPARVEALVLGEALATTIPDPAHPWGPDPAVIEAVAASLEEGNWGKAILLPLIAPSVSSDERLVAWFRRLERSAATPNMAANILRHTMSTDVRSLLPAVAAPALVLHRKDAPFLPSEGIRWLAEHLPNGRYVEVPGDQVPGYLGDVDSLMDEVEEFLVGTRTGRTADLRVVTVLFSDLVESTRLAASVGDRRWQALLEFHRTEVRRLLGRHGGREIDTAGDGFLVAFDTPSSAVDCGLEICRTGREAGLETRVGIHTGEVEVAGDDLVGLAVHIGARVSALASANQVLVSQTVRDVLIGSRFELEPRGRYELKGVPGTWEVLEVLA